ncbi:hypothetical protein GGS24DRAFT_489541 [Hypoxylon argillaceum]|nr:hypothetical protein GGS24DRAFT_489541 [Hypoxylon argillaceum]
MAEILRSDLQNLDFPTAVGITDVEHLSSYNWIEASSPTIVVPGSPALWAPPGGSTRVTKDSGLVYIDENTARHPDSPSEPLFLALYIAQPAFDISSTDVVTDRNNLRKLLSFVEPGIEGDALEPFTIGIEIHKNTALFSRISASSQEVIPPGEFRGFGHQFEKVYTRHQINGSSAHHRIVSYRFGDMKFIVRHETDGYVGENMKLYPSSIEESQTDGLSGALKSLSLTSEPTLVDLPSDSSKLLVRREGRTIPLNCTLEIKTRAIHRHIRIGDVAPQLWLSQTPKLIRAYHRHGTFQEPQVEDVTSDIQNWQKQNQVKLKKFAALIRKVVDIVKRCDNKATVRYVRDGDKLIISPLHGNNVLPDNLYLKWEVKPAPPSSMQETLTPIAATQPRSDHDSPTILRHDNILYFDEVVRGLSKGPRHFFRIMPTRLSDYRVLCDTLKFLCVDVLEGRTLRHIMDDFRSGKSDWDPDERRVYNNSKSLARDSAFRLLYTFLSNELVSDPKDKPMAYNAAFFVVSHPRMFRWKPRKMVLEAFEQRFGVSSKQRANLAKWPIKDSLLGGESEDDQTTEFEEGDFYYDSDFS